MNLIDWWFRVWNVSKVKFNQRIFFPTTDDHSKWGVSDDKAEWICVGDINRAVRSLTKKFVIHFRNNFSFCWTDFPLNFINASNDFYRKCKQNAEEEVFAINRNRFRIVIVCWLPISSHVQLELLQLTPTPYAIREPQNEFINWVHLL